MIFSPLCYFVVVVRRTSPIELLSFLSVNATAAWIAYEKKTIRFQRFSFSIYRITCEMWISANAVKMDCIIVQNRHRFTILTSIGHGLWSTGSVFSLSRSLSFQLTKNMHACVQNSFGSEKMPSSSRRHQRFSRVDAKMCWSFENLYDGICHRTRDRSTQKYWR